MVGPLLSPGITRRTFGRATPCARKYVSMASTFEFLVTTYARPCERNSETKSLSTARRGGERLRGQVSKMFWKRRRPSLCRTYRAIEIEKDTKRIRRLDELRDVLGVASRDAARVARRAFASKARARVRAKKPGRTRGGYRTQSRVSRRLFAQHARGSNDP